VARRRHTALIAAAASGCVIAALIALLATRGQAKDKQAPSPLLGQPAPAVSGDDINGHPARLSDLRGKYVFLNFFASWCVPCHQEQPELERWQARHAAKGDATILGVLFEDSASNARQFVAANGGDWPIVVDPAPDYPAALHYGVRGPPESYLINPDGIVLAKFIGIVSADGLDQLLARAQGAA
jgi:cytochrome c biogenesis protein CcmG/thiol:disulfide interchange protein DsbE